MEKCPWATLVDDTFALVCSHLTHAHPSPSISLALPSPSLLSLFFVDKLSQRRLRSDPTMHKMIKELLKCDHFAMACILDEEGGGLELLKWARSSPFPCPWSSTVFAHALSSKSKDALAMVTWLFDNYVPLTQSVYSVPEEDIAYRQSNEMYNGTEYNRDPDEIQFVLSSFIPSKEVRAWFSKAYPNIIIPNGPRPEDVEEEITLALNGDESVSSTDLIRILGRTFSANSPRLRELLDVYILNLDVWPPPVQDLQVIYLKAAEHEETLLLARRFFGEEADELLIRAVFDGLLKSIRLEALNEYLDNHYDVIARFDSPGYMIWGHCGHGLQFWRFAIEKIPQYIRFFGQTRGKGLLVYYTSDVELALWILKDSPEVIDNVGPQLLVASNEIFDMYKVMATSPSQEVNLWLYQFLQHNRMDLVEWFMRFKGNRAHRGICQRYLSLGRPDFIIWLFNSKLLALGDANVR